MDPPLVLVRWADAWFDYEHGPDGGFRDEYVVQTVGFLLRDDDGLLSLAQELLPERDGYRAITHIPRATVRQIERLRPNAEPEPG